MSSLLMDLGLLARGTVRALPVALLLPMQSMQSGRAQRSMRFLGSADVPWRAALVVVLASVFARDTTLGPLADPAAVLLELLRGLAIGTMLAVPLWTAQHLGALADELRGVQAEQAGPLASVAALLATLAWLHGLCARLQSRRSVALPSADVALSHALHLLSQLLGRGLLLASVLLLPMLAYEVFVAALARSSSPLEVAKVGSLLRPFVAIAVLAAVLPLVLRAVGS